MCVCVFVCFCNRAPTLVKLYIYIYSLFVHNFMSNVSPCVGYTLIFLLLYMKTSMFKEIILHNQFNCYPQIVLE